MTRDEMQAIQREPVNPQRHMRVSRPKAIAHAIARGRAAGVDPKTGWWKELAILTKPERAQVRAELAAQREAAAVKVRLSPSTTVPES